MTAEISVHRASPEEADIAFAIVEEYNEAVNVLVRDQRSSFLHEYFGNGGGLWLAQANHETVGCIGLRPLREPAGSGEVKRLYVRPAWRGQGIAEALLRALETYARDCAYEWIYLDSKDDLVAAIRFYARQGYTACERYNANPQATVFMRKQIGQF